ncbi:hypothetical protein D3C85_249910 [compost metagenome]
MLIAGPPNPTTTLRRVDEGRVCATPLVMTGCTAMANVPPRPPAIYASGQRVNPPVVLETVTRSPYWPGSSWLMRVWLGLSIPQRAAGCPARTGGRHRRPGRGGVWIAGCLTWTSCARCCLGKVQVVPSRSGKRRDDVQMPRSYLAAGPRAPFSLSMSFLLILRQAQHAHAGTLKS